MSKTTYITVAIPYVNAEPHLGYAYELVQADIRARAGRLAGDRVRFLGGTDEYSLKNVLAAEAAGLDTETFVASHAAKFAGLAEPLAVSFDDFIRTSSDPRHRPAVERIWAAAKASGDLYQQDYEGDYCVGCEQFYEPGDQADGGCPDHGPVLERVVEQNWFFRLSRYAEQILERIESGAVEIAPEPFRREVISFVRNGLTDISVSRSAHRAHGWGIPVPGDPDQVIYVWFDALTNYLSALDYGTDGSAFDEWWRDADERIHVIGKGILRFHAAYWPAFLLSAGEPLPTRIQVHPYLTVNGKKISKSDGANTRPGDIVDAHGQDALRWFYAREVSEAVDTDFTVARLVAGATTDLANLLGNTTSRLTTLVHRFLNGIAPDDQPPIDACTDLGQVVSGLTRGFRHRDATKAIVDAATSLNRHIEDTAPWVLARDRTKHSDLAVLLGAQLASARALAAATEPIVPALACRLNTYLGTPGRALPVLSGPPFARPEPPI